MSESLPLPLNTSIRATYQDGFVLDETSLTDVNPYGEGNTFRAVLDKSAEQEHGRLVKFSVFWNDTENSVDWTTLPDNARPIRFRNGFLKRDIGTGETVSGWSGAQFGYQYNNEDGKNIQEVQELI